MSTERCRHGTTPIAACAECGGEMALESLDFIRNRWSRWGARPCPACVYVDGKFIRSCKIHEHVDELQKEIDVLRKENTELHQYIETGEWPEPKENCDLCETALENGRHGEAEDNCPGPRVCNCAANDHWFGVR